MSKVTNKRRVIAFVAGKSGGHIIPALTIAKHYKPDHEILFFSTDGELDRKICQGLDGAFLIDHYVPLSFGRTLGSRLLTNIVLLQTCITSFFVSFCWLARLKPHKIISTGGALSVPVCLAAWILRISIELLELNATPGRAIRFLAPYAQRISACFSSAQPFFNRSVQVTAYPLKFKQEDLLEKKRARELLADALAIEIPNSSPVILILGGSQGSHFINTIAMQFVEHAQAVHAQIFHQTGSADLIALREFYQRKQQRAYVFDYSSVLHLYYSACDVVICRAGAGTLFELSFFKKRAIVIPLKTTMTAHQLDNALAFEKEHRGITIMDQSALLQEPQPFFDLLANSIKRPQGS